MRGGRTGRGTLALRPPLEVWHGGQPGVFGRLLQTLGEFISDVDLRALEAVLAQPAMAPTRSLALACERAVTAQRVELRCRGGDGAALSARLSAQRLRIDRLVLPAGEVRYGLDFQGRGANFRSRGPLLRSAAGEVLQAIEVADDSVSLHFVDDLAPLRLGLARMAEETLAGRSDALAAQPLRRAAVLTPLLAGFGIAGPRLPAVRPQPARVAVAAVAAEPVAADLLPFYRHCAACHDLPDAFPPGFLRGDAATVRARIDRCAPRMLQRLAMWAQPGGLRSKTPMPPPAAPQAAALRAPPDGLAMRSWLEGRLAAQGLDPLAILRQPYADLPDCATYRGM